MEALEVKLVSPSRLGFGKCRSAQDGGQQQPFSLVLWFNVRSSLHFNYSTVSERSSSSLRSIKHSPLRPSPTADNFLVLASPHYVSLLWSPITGSRFSCFLPPTIFSITRRVIRTIAGTVCLAITLCNDLFDMPLPFGINAISWSSIIVYISLYLVEAEPRHPFEFPWPSGLHGAIPSMGIDGIQLDTPWHDSKGRDYGSCDWTRMVLLLGCLPAIA